MKPRFPIWTMCGYLDSHGELYFIEALENGAWTAIGDATVKPENPPIAIWRGDYLGRGIGRRAMQAVIARLRQRGCEKITGSTVYKWNQASLHMHQNLGFRIVGETEREYYLELDLSQSRN
ncbi:GNAT family N-acetyltransferase [Acutalibacter sp. 1XD8-33]|uniref:GNAT family N-acetyltransferase n=1 Tax=Acutalibacter sp. 1XD8-33 TaxID=2320081 RepID=UPI000EA34E4A|nr:GNAT family N-acetyltransferase [Acutalibacter sp. 1XD8-33]RKJ42200.1 GNAT family N-acetyltransferase [Acutalibacter sp. 1XD8-33]